VEVEGGIQTTLQQGVNNPLQNTNRQNAETKVSYKASYCIEYLHRAGSVFVGNLHQGNRMTATKTPKQAIDSIKQRLVSLKWQRQKRPW